jgi:hypothetical protein
MSGTTSKVSKATALARVQAIIAGTKKHFPNGSLTIGNVAFTEASLVGLFQGLADAVIAESAARASAKGALSALRETNAKVSPVFRAFKRIVLDTFGSATEILADFGLEPPKARKPLSGEQIAAATVKRRATRTARGTIGKRKKLAIKGDVTGIVVTPVTHAPASPPSAAEPTSNAQAASGAPK